MKTHIISVPVVISIESPNGTDKVDVEIVAKMLIAATLEARGDVFEKHLPEGWTAWVTSRRPRKKAATPLTTKPVQI